MSNSHDDITALLADWSDGKPQAFPRLVAVAYDDLRAIARRRLRNDGNGSADLATTELVHEAYLRLVRRDVSTDSWQDRAHFYAFVSRAMRSILVDHARRINAARRGGDSTHVPLEPNLLAARDATDVLGIDAAIDELAVRSPRMAQVVEMRFFAGFSVLEVADVLQLSARTVEREWTRARAYLLESLGDAAGNA